MSVCSNLCIIPPPAPRTNDQRLCFSAKTIDVGVCKRYRKRIEHGRSTDYGIPYRRSFFAGRIPGHDLATC